MIFPPSQNVEAPILIHLYSQSSPVFVSGLSPHPDPRIKINPGVPSPGTEIAPPFQPSISASPPPYTTASTTVPFGDFSWRALPESTSQGILFITTFPSMADMPPSKNRLSGFSVRTIDPPAGINSSLNVDIQGVVDLMRSMVQPVKFTTSLPKLLNSNQSLSRLGTSPGIRRVNLTSYFPFHSEGCKSVGVSGLFSSSIPPIFWLPGVDCSESIHSELPLNGILEIPFDACPVVTS